MSLWGFRVVKCKPFGTILLALSYACLQVTASFDSVYRRLCKCVFAELYAHFYELKMVCIDADMDVRNACAWLSRDIWSHFIVDNIFAWFDISFGHVRLVFQLM